MNSDSQLRAKPVMKPTSKVALGALLAAFLVPAPGAAQDPVPGGRKPNILFVVDTSGSMEYMTDSSSCPTPGEPCYPSCYPAEPDPTQHQKSRWIDVLEVLTGSFPAASYACAAEDRSSSNFISEFSLYGNIEPPDANYRNPYHRVVSNGCTITAERDTPANLTNAFDWAPPARTPYPVNTSLPLAGCAGGFVQEPNGFIDANGSVARFGLMTFDPLPDPSLGHGGATDYTPNYTEGVTGAWSYFVDSAGFATGRPADCIDAPHALEVGVRSGAAPATEGKMIYFGHQDLSDIRDAARHDRIQQVLLGTRPYGATPLNGALQDVSDFFWVDDALEPTDNDSRKSGDTLYGTVGDNLNLSPAYDNYVECGCREQHVILITDGEPNLDLRPHCSDSASDPSLPGKCPFPDPPATILSNLAADAPAGQLCPPATPGANRYPIYTHVVGFATATYVDSGGITQNCSELTTLDPNWDGSGGSCENPATDDLKVCCILHELADAGGGAGNNALPYIASDAATLRNSLSDIIRRIVPRAATATRPVRSPGKGKADASNLAAFRLLTSYEPSTGTGGLWRGNVERVRWECDAGVPVARARDQGHGDDFSFNVAKNASDRTFSTFVPNSPIDPSGTLRPNIGGQDDGAGTTTAGSTVTQSVTGFPSAVRASALGVNATADAACIDTGAPDDDTCRNRILQWTMGLSDGTNDRCPTPSDRDTCSVLGDVMHSTPTIVDRPRADVEDETYNTFATTHTGRMMMGYMSSNDGQLHAFNLSPNDTSDPIVDNDENNESYSFIPPVVLPNLKTQYPVAGLASRLQLLDGVAVTQDVVATAYAAGINYKFKLERTTTSLANSGNTWRSILVQAFGGPQPGYFALDITDATEPEFLWQLTTSSGANPLFGTGGQPIITTINLDGSETAVAVLPGGAGGSPIGTGCGRSDSAVGTWETNTHWDPTNTGPAFAPRAAVNCYPATSNAARSLTIVRLDSGLILRRFIRDASDPADNLGLSGVFAATPVPDEPFLDSPITGTPAAYPAGVGMVADRIFVGDQDGTMWRVDLSSVDPEEWSMKLFFDSYAIEPGPNSGVGKPIITAPAVSVDARGMVTIAYGTGDQDLSGGATDVQFVYSLTEVENANSGGFDARVNWYTRLEGGEHTLGPFTLLGGALYFSTISPAGTSVCDEPSSTIWGVDYVQAYDASDLSQGGAWRLQPATATAAVNKLSADSLVSGGGQVGAVFGVSLEYVPSCGTPDQATDTAGMSNTAITDATPPPLQLVFQTATLDTSNAGLGFNTGFEAITLAPPKTASNIMSWATILD